MEPCRCRADSGNQEDTGDELHEKGECELIGAECKASALRYILTILVCGPWIWQLNAIGITGMRHDNNEAKRASGSDMLD